MVSRFALSLAALRRELVVAFGKGLSLLSHYSHLILETLAVRRYLRDRLGFRFEMTLEFPDAGSGGVRIFLRVIQLVREVIFVRRQRLDVSLQSIHHSLLGP